MFKEVLIFALTAIAPGASIIGGLPANITDFPWQVSIFIEVGINNGLLCGGFLIAPDWVLTAGRCVATAEGNKNTLRAGSNYIMDGGKVYNVSQSVLHPDFNNKNLTNNIGLFKLSTPVDPSLGSAIPLPAANKSVPNNSSLTITGYGFTSAANLSDGLLQVTVPVVNRETCRKAYGAIITDNKFCAGDFDKGGKDACSGDYGGPAVLDGKVVGIMSWGSCGKPGFPGVYTQISNYVNWINQYVTL